MKPCRQCGTSLPNGAKQCKQCGAEQKDMQVKPFVPPDAPRLKPLSKWEQSLMVLLELALWASPLILAFVGHHFFGTTGLIVGVLVGVALPILMMGIN